jgi:3-dehydroquinate synthetase/shikimate kinase
MSSKQGAGAKDRRPPTIVVTGFMGTGKSSVGRSLAGMLGVPFFDTDKAIEEAQGRSIAEIFAEDGEEVFRRMERELCEKIFDDRGAVVSTGGGTLLDERTYDLFSRRATIVLLEASLESLAARLAGGRDRPLLQRKGATLAGADLRKRIEEILVSRAPVYGKIATKFDTSDATSDETAARIATSLDFPVESLAINPMGRMDVDPHDPHVLRGRFGISQVEIGRGALSRLGAYLTGVGLTTHAFLLMPETTRNLYLTQIVESLDDAGIPHSVIGVDDGDMNKNVAQTEQIIDRLIDAGARRDAAVVPIGGGVTGDIGGFAASLFMRGVPFVHVPTTLLAQVDSSIGGKVGVNHPLAKNLIGAFYQPHLVLIDPCTLRSLPFEEVSNGMAEVVKAALIDSEPFFAFLEGHVGSDAHRCLADIEFLERCVLEAARIKCKIVNEDPYERDRRRTINLGHTVGHALEASARYRGLKHGQAVSLGLIAAFRISTGIPWRVGCGSTRRYATTGCTTCYPPRSVKPASSTTWPSMRSCQPWSEVCREDPRDSWAKPQPARHPSTGDLRHPNAR